MRRQRRFSSARKATPLLLRLVARRPLRLALIALAALALWWFLHGPGTPVPAPDGAASPAPAGETLPPAAPAAAPEGRAAAAADHLAGFLHAARQAAEDGRWGKAFAELDAAAAAPHVQGALAERLRACERELLAGLDAAVERIAASVEAGDVLIAADALARARQPADARVERALATTLTAHRWPWYAAALPAGAPPIGSVTPLADGRAVRLRFRGAWSAGRVVGWRHPTDAARAEATVEVAAGATRSYGIVRRAALEPVEATLAEAIDQARAARCAGDAAVFAAWIATCFRQGGGEHPDVVELLAGLPR